MEESGSLPQKIRRFGWRPDLPDMRDQRLQLPRSLLGLPAKVDLRPGFPAVWDQGELGSCTAHAALACYQYTALEEKRKPINYSRLFEYYVTRILENTVDWDSGASIRNSIKALNTYGVCLESDWKYIQSKFAKKPTQACFDYGAKKILKTYARVMQTEFDLTSCLAQGNPVTFGFSVYSSFEGEEIANTGRMTMPSPGERVIGGHAVVLCGYDLAKRIFYVRNSWSSDWGLDGYFTMPMEFVLNSEYCDDFWCIIGTL